MSLGSSRSMEASGQAGPYARLPRNATRRRGPGGISARPPSLRAQRSEPTTRQGLFVEGLDGGARLRRGEGRSPSRMSRGWNEVLVRVGDAERFEDVGVVGRLDRVIATIGRGEVELAGEPAGDH